MTRALLRRVKAARQTIQRFPGDIQHMTSVQQAEEQASEKVWPDLQAHVVYLNDVYNLAFRIQTAIHGKRIADISEVARAQLMILMRITDFLRSIQLLSVKCYPEQAGTLAASIFELAHTGGHTHTAALFMRSPADASKWLGAGSVKEQVPRKIFGINWKDLVKAICDHCGAKERAESEYQVYEQLCWMKHSLPKMQDMRVDQDGVSLIFEPHERALSHAWFSMEHAGRLTEFVIALLMSEFGTEETREDLRALAQKNAELRSMAIARFGQGNPFNETA